MDLSESSQEVKKQHSQEVVKKFAKRARIMESDEEMNDKENVENNLAKQPGMKKDCKQLGPQWLSTLLFSPQNNFVLLFLC